MAYDEQRTDLNGILEIDSFELREENQMSKINFADMQIAGLFGDAGETIASGEMHWYGTGAARRFCAQLACISVREKQSQRRERDH